jgi:hypothetical protein
MKKKSIYAAVAVICTVALMVSLPSAGLASEDVPLADGELWSKSSRLEKVAYIIGVGNLMVVEFLYQEGAKQKPSDDQTIIQRLYDAADGITLDGMIERIDQWYKTHPDQMKEPVLVVIWNELVEK